MDASQYKDYVLFMLFIKYISDKYGNSDDFAPPVVIPPGASFTDMIALKGKPDIGDRINTQIIAPLVEANARLSKSDFPDFNDPNKLGESREMVDKLTNLIAIFQKPELDFSKNRAEHDDILGDAYEYLMRHFATESGKSKGQFYTPAEVSRLIARVIGISPDNTVASTTVYDPTCGSGSLLLKVAAEAGRHITLEGQEKDVTTAGLARMNMILHDFPTATILSGNTLAAPKFRDPRDDRQLRTYDYVVANPPFSDKTWSTGLKTPDEFQRFTWGMPPAKQGDYAYLLHIVRSLKATGKGACILPHGVLFRGNAEAVIREQLVRSGMLKGIIGLPANLFYGTGIPACILVLDKENAQARKGVFMLDASRGSMKDGNKNRLREQDLHRIVDTFNRQADTPRYARMVPFAEIADAKNDFNLNLPRYIDATEPEDLQDIAAHLQGGIPERDVAALNPYWQVLLGVRADLFAPLRPGYLRLTRPLTEVKPAIFAHPEFAAFTRTVTDRFAHWRTGVLPELTTFGQDSHPKPLIATLAESLLAAFQPVPLLDAYDLFQHLMDYWAATMQDDCYLISADGWLGSALPREIFRVKNKDNRLVWPEPHDYLVGKRRYKSDLVPAALLVDRFFAAEREAIERLDSELAGIEQQLDELREEQGGEEGLLVEVIEGEGDRQKITARAIKARLKEIGRDPDYAEERAALRGYAKLLDQQAVCKARRKAAAEELDRMIHDLYPKLTEAEIKSLVVDDKWLAFLNAAVQGELDRVSQTLTGRIRVLAERYATSLPQLTAEIDTLAARVEGHLRKMGKDV
jgi:type I restriction enzyme M protein